MLNNAGGFVTLTLSLNGCVVVENESWGGGSEDY